jgi:hypothetical protein
MTRQGWAERKVERKLGGQYISLSPKLTAELLLAEHRRAVRVVKRQLDLYQRQREVEKDKCKRDLLAGSIFACVDLLESLQRGRE